MATTQGARQTTLNATRSSNFVRFMLAGALHKIAFKRGVFPRGAFAPSDRFGGAEALQARDDPVARRLLDQLGKGVFAAVKAKYARTITYYVVGPPSDVRANVRASEDAADAADAADERKSSHESSYDESEADDDERERVLEEYAFTIRYGDQTGAGDEQTGDIFENVSVRAGRRGISRKTAWGASPSASSLDDEEKIKDAGDQMLRQLEALIEHLEPAPTGSRIGIRLTYVDATPPEYEPPFFESVEPTRGTIGDGDERADCGAVETRFHALSLRWTRRIAGADRDGAGADDPGARETRVRHAGAAENDGAEPPEKKASALVPFPFESQPEPEPEPAAECRDYHYLSQSEPQPDSESPGLDAAAPAGPPPRIGWADGFANGPAFSLTGSLSLSRAPPSPFKPVGGGSRGAGRGAGDSAASFSFGGRASSLGGSQASLGANASLGFGGFGGFGGLGGLGGGGFGSPIRRGTAAAAEKLATGKRAGAFPTPPSTPWRKRLRSADAVAI